MTVKRSNMKKISKKDEEQKRKNLIIILLLILFLFLFKILNVYDFIFDIPSKPEVMDTNKKGENEWHSDKIIKIEKDAKARKGIKYYLYCINQDKTTRNCRWKRTYTKNVTVSKSGIHYVYFKGVNEDGIIGKPSDPTIIKIDNEAPIILDLMSKATTSTIKVKIKAEDLGSGIDKYYYKIDEGDFIESDKNSYTFKDLLENHLYYVTIKIVDKLGNAKEITFPVRTMSKESNKNQDQNKDEDDNNNEGNNNEGNSNSGNNDDGNSNGGNNNGGNSSGDNNHGGNGNEGNNNEGNNNGGDNSNTPIKEIPQLSLSGVPKNFEYGDQYQLPTSYKFGKSGGTVKCTVANKEYKDTSTIPIGKNNIVCIAKSNTGISVKEEKEVTVTVKNKEEEIWSGWITMNLYYPEKSTDWKWRLGKEDEVRSDQESGWKDYTGPITIRVSDIENVYIKYTLENGEDVVVVPNGRLAVDIEPNSYHVIEGNTTLVKIYYSEGADKKQYRINYGEWKDYTGAFEVSNDTAVEARIIKTENIYDGDELIDIRKQTNYDSVYIATTIITNPNPSNPSESIDGSEEKIEYGPNYHETPSYSISGPNIDVEPETELVEQVKVHLTTEQQARRIYYKLSVNDAWKEYSEPFIVDKNLTVYAKYITKDGETSQISSELITNIKRGNLPNVSIVVRYPSQEKANVMISGNDYEKLEYSLDGKIYHEYKNELTITKNCTVYARAINPYGMEKTSQSITIFKEPPIRENLNISIFTNPDKDDIKGIANKTTVSIHYDQKAEDRYYRIGFGEWEKYEGPFELNQNATIYAYATSETGYGMAEKQVDFLTKGISNPSIIPDTAFPTPSVSVSINYDKNSTIKKYKIDNGEWLNYEEPFIVDKNCTIYAYNENVLGYQAESEYEITNITEIPRYTEVVNREGYLILKLNYPSSSNRDSREYKWSIEGAWKKYDDQGILLIKEKYKDQLINKENSSVTVADENGKAITFSDHYYIIEDSLEEMIGNLFMRWDYKSVEKPVIEIKPSEPSRFVNATIHYDSHFGIKEYKTIEPDGVESEWLPYTGKVKITKNNTIIYARGKIDHHSKELISSQIVTNIDNNAPKVNIRADLETPTHKLDIQIIGTDDQKVKIVGYARGEQDASYFEDYGVMLENNSTFTVSENGKYTIYVEDSVRNTNTKVIEITNIVEKSSSIDIEVLTKKYGTEAEIEIDYGNCKNIQYKIGINGVYTAYKDKFTIHSNEILNLANKDGTITIYARGITETGNIEEVTRVVYVLDLDAPTSPVISATSGYPTLTEYGIKGERTVNIVYDNRNDIDNYYSVDNGKTWELYKGVFETDAPSIQAKSIKNNSGLTIQTEKALATPNNILKGEAYDGNISTYVGAGEPKRLDISQNMVGNKIKITTSGNGNVITFYDSSSKSIFRNRYYDSPNIITIPEGTSYMTYSHEEGCAFSYLYELSVYTNPEINVEKVYPTLTEYGVESGYSKVKINYFQTAVKKLYSVDGGKNWNNYEGEIKLPLGEKIEAKSIDRYGNESSISSYTSVLAEDALGIYAYDGDSTTRTQAKEKAKLTISKEMVGNKIKIATSGNGNVITFYDSSSKSIFRNRYYDSPNIITIPEGTSYMTYSHEEGCAVSYLYELSVYTNPEINVEKVYPTLTEYGVESGYSKVKINYFQTAVKKLYSVDGGKNWNNYEGEIKLLLGEKIEAKSIDRYGDESSISSYTSVLAEDALGIYAYDGKMNTYVSAGEAKRINISQNMIGNKIKITTSGNGNLIAFYDSSSKIISRVGYYSSPSIITIPERTSYMTYAQEEGSAQSSLYEVIPTIDNTSYSLKSKKTNTLKSISSPIITVSDEEIWTPSKSVTITYAGENYINEYSIDSVNWISYEGPIRITEPGTIYARSKKDAVILSTSSHNIMKVDNKEPKVSLDYLPYAIRIGSSYSLPSYQSFDDNISGGKTICYANNVVVSSTENLGVGTYQIKCIATTGAGIQSISEKKLQVIDILEDTDHTQPEIGEVPNDNTPIGENEEEDEGLVANIETTVPRRNPKAANNTEETQE